MKIHFFVLIFITCTLLGCTQVQDQIISQTTISPPPINSPTSTKLLLPTSTLLPNSSPSATATSISMSTPLPGHFIWVQGSLQKDYAIQYPEEAWTLSENSLTHKHLQGCILGIGGGSDICMSGGCVTSNIILGKIEFGKTVVSNTNAIYSSYPMNIHLLYQAWLGETTEKCMQEVESVLGTIKLRPERTCTDHAEFIEDVNIPDDTPIPSNTSFTKTWRIKNTGSCIWTQAYSLFLVGITPNADVYHKENLQSIIQPDQSIDISVELITPPSQGIARWEWMLQNETGDLFGVGDGPYNPWPGTPFRVQITVVPAQNP